MFKKKRKMVDREKLIHALDLAILSFAAILVLAGITATNFTGYAISDFSKLKINVTGAIFFVVVVAGLFFKLKFGRKSKKEKVKTKVKNSIKKSKAKPKKKRK